MQGDAELDGAELTHVWPTARDDFEIGNEATYCRRCGRLLAADRRPEFVQSKPCRRVPITFRGASC